MKQGFFASIHVYSKSHIRIIPKICERVPPHLSADLHTFKERHSQELTSLHFNTDPSEELLFDMAARISAATQKTVAAAYGVLSDWIHFRLYDMGEAVSELRFADGRFVTMDRVGEMNSYFRGKGFKGYYLTCLDGIFLSPDLICPYHCDDVRGELSSKLHVRFHREDWFYEWFRRAYEVDHIYPNSQITIYRKIPIVPPPPPPPDPLMANPSLPHNVDMLSRVAVLPYFEDAPSECPLWYLGNDRELPVLLPSIENGRPGYCEDDMVYVIRHEDGSIETAPEPVPYNGVAPDIDHLRKTVGAWNHTLFDYLEVIGVDFWGYLYVYDMKNRYYIISPEQDRYQRLKITGELAGWYLNTSGQMCFITDNRGFDRWRNNIVRVYRVTPIMDEA